MQIKHLACSNIFNFNFKSDLHIPYHGVNFDISSNTSDVHIVVGSSGSGKSQFFKIIFQLWNFIWYYPVECLLDHIDKNPNTVLTFRKTSFDFATFHHPDLPGTIIIQIHLWSVDLVKLNWLNQNIYEINHIIKHYCEDDHTLVAYDGVCDSEYITFQYQISYHNKTVILLTWDKFTKFVDQYLRYYNLIKHCITIHNTIDTNQLWTWRDEIFGHVTGMRDMDILTLSQMSTYLSSPPLSTTIDIAITLQTSTTLQVILQICKIVVWSNNQITWYYQQIFQDVVHYIKTYLDLQLQCHMQNDYVFFQFINRRKQTLTFDQLSSSDQASIVIMCNLIWSMTKFGIIVIEEPELHLHPQYQLIITHFLYVFAKEHHVQIILNTNSSLIINESNIDNVFRLYTTEQWIHIVNPVIVEQWNEARLSQILTFTNSAKLFFVDMIILVEGETDEYFFKRYFYDMNIKSGYNKLINTFQIININGKWSLKMRADFLTKFQIRYRFIWDWDNIVEIGININIGKYLHQAKKTHHWYASKSEQYDTIIYNIQTQSPKLWDKIVKSIENARKKNILILSHGDFESYLWLQGKWLDVTIDFIQHDYVRRQTEYRFATARQELETFYHLIFGV
jgi:putative ATP-dependent endonuclease of OLD family